MAYSGYEDYFSKRVIISVATTGGHHGKEANPNLPTQPEEVAKDIRACEEAGASIVHLHARDDEGENTKSVERYQELRDRIDEYCDDIIVNFTTGGGGIFSREERIAPILETEPRPEMATVDLGPINFGQTRTAVNTREQNEEYAERMRDAGVKPELELFNPGQIPEAEHLIEKGLLEEPYWATAIFGMQNGMPAGPGNLVTFVENLPDPVEWQCLAVGKHQLPMTTMAMAMGGHVRVGMEDNIYYRKGELAESNAQLVERAARIADELGRPVATPEDTRDMLGL
ncbi:3-keto-5-aminohexanoate cleavage protein [Natronomonas sp. CBA1123]|jgi:3-keto-5-aminohexanoate cleavage enzyme|uniref:3-keto-5-aminohexanoate cleavage protein n=1 Tax=Natronomonas sp. CBA1123 TaxID=2668070 RepID=UPI0012E9B939|nr:3-keto-5-aminohexanoate cleavage protein [Natronomonas sp. CBA1123]MUV85585.1 3-keto-5-aminohexanoate cleavage protein [Natronomonas sp. CBA1123]